MEILHFFDHSVIPVAVEIGVIMFELAGIIAMLLTGIKGIYNFVTKNPETRLQLAKGMGMGLEFKLGSEILHTVTAATYYDIGLIACIFLLRAALTFLLHWEIEHEHPEGENGEKGEKKQRHKHEPHA